MVSDNKICNADRKLTPPSKIANYLIAIPIIGFLLLATSFAASAWGTSEYPVPRTVSISQYIFSITLVIWGVVAGLGIKSELRRNETSLLIFCLLCTVILYFGPIHIIKKQYEVEWPTAHLFAHQWDQRDSILNMAAKGGIEAIGVTETINYYDLEQLLPDSPSYQWINAEMSNYYRIKNIYLDTSNK